MALVHFLYVGHFVPEHGWVRFQGHQPFVARPINMAAVASLLNKRLGTGAENAAPPENWHMTIKPDCIVCDALGSPRPALEFAADYAESQGATVIDQAAFLLVTPEQLRQAAAAQRTQQ